MQQYLLQLRGGISKTPRIVPIIILPLLLSAMFMAVFLAFYGLIIIVTPILGPAINRTRHVPAVLEIHCVAHLRSCPVVCFLW